MCDPNDQEERARFEAAAKIRAEAFEGPVYFDGTYYATARDFLEYLDGDVYDRGGYAWACARVAAQLSYDHILEDLERRYWDTEADEFIGADALDALRAFITAWNAIQVPRAYQVEHKLAVTFGPRTTPLALVPGLPITALELPASSTPDTDNSEAF